MRRLFERWRDRHPLSGIGIDEMREHFDARTNDLSLSVGLRGFRLLLVGKQRVELEFAVDLIDLLGIWLIAPVTEPAVSAIALPTNSRRGMCW